MLMKTVLILLLSLLSFIPVMSQTSKDIKRYKEYIKEFDVYDAYLDGHEGDASYFWNTVVRYNQALNSFYDGMSKRKLRKTVEEYERISQSTSSMGLDDISTDKELQEWIIHYMQGDYPDRPLKNICIYYDGTFNAFSTPDGYLAVSDLLFSSCENYELIGILAHEMAHYVLQHHMVHQDYKKKQKRKNTVLAILSAVGTSVAAAAIQSGGGMTQEQADSMWDSVMSGNDALIDAFSLRTILSNYKYSREQEIEADILAFRFLEFMGVSPEDYIKALENLVENNYELLKYTDDKFSDHPFIMHRINILRMLE